MKRWLRTSESPSFRYNPNPQKRRARGNPSATRQSTAFFPVILEFITRSSSRSQRQRERSAQRNYRVHAHGVSGESPQFPLTARARPFYRSQSEEERSTRRETFLSRLPAAAMTGLWGSSSQRVCISRSALCSHRVIAWICPLHVAVCWRRDV